MKVGIVVPYSWSFWGAVVEHAELQAAALRKLGLDARSWATTRPAASRGCSTRGWAATTPAADVIPVGRSVIVPANGSLPNVILSPRTVPRIKRTLEREDFDLLHIHEPMTPAIGVGALALAQCPVVATFHASGTLAWTKIGMPLWGFLLDRLDARIAVSEAARQSAQSYAPGEYEIVPNGVLVPPNADPGGASTPCSSSGGRSSARACGAPARVAGDSRAHRRAAAHRRRGPARSAAARRARG